MSFDSYQLDPAVYDEMFLPDGSTREHARALFDALSRMSSDELASVQGRVNRTFSRESISFTVYGDAEAEERIIPVDPIPRCAGRSRLERAVRGTDPAGAGPELLPPGCVRRGADH